MTTNSQARFGTFGGVFTPCTLTILGVIMFLRFGQVIGNTGLLQGVLVVLLAKVITTSTALSLSAIATNTKVKGGGAYFVISRSLGVEFGGAIGIVFFLSQAVSVAMYVIGFTEALVDTVPYFKDYPIVTASVVNVIVFICVYIGAGWTMKLQYFILAVLMLSIGAFVVGAIGCSTAENFTANLGSGYIDKNSFLVMFALFFPAATGIMAGANMSGDLKLPSRSIPLGTLLSIVFTAFIYICFAVLLSASATREQLLSDNMIVSKISISEYLIVAGVFAATLSSALGSLMGAPRILQALAKDDVFKTLKPFSKVEGASNEPRRATIVSFVLAQLGIMVGDLNAIAPVITMFFMITYGALNFATFCEAYSGNPSYRPTFKYCHWTVSLLGTILCVATMFLIDPIWALIAIVIMFAIYRHLSKQELEAAWSDVASGTAFERVRRNLLILEQEKYHPKNWRPTVLVFGAAREERLYLAVHARWLAGKHGLLIIGQVLKGEGDEILSKYKNANKILRKYIYDNELDAFPSYMIAPSLTVGISSMAQTSGIGALKPNLIMFGWNDNLETRDEFFDNIRAVNTLGKSVAVLKVNGELGDVWDVEDGTIDVWWLGEGNGNLMVLLAHLIKSNAEWKSHTIRLLRMIKNENGKEETLRHLKDLISNARIKAECEVFVNDDYRAVLEENGRQSAITILGLPNPDEEYFEKALLSVSELSKPIKRVLFVHSAGDMSLQ